MQFLYFWNFNSTSNKSRLHKAPEQTTTDRDGTCAEGTAKGTLRLAFPCSRLRSFMASHYKREGACHVPPSSQAPRLWRFQVLRSPRGLSKPSRNRKDKIHSPKSRGQAEASQGAVAGGQHCRATHTYPSAGVADELDE